ncbi:MAG TPA: tripartite tricarboxylate transporter permease [archaeon]|nr:tripartite tricarboxylate transporter permease [archaeon]
MLDILLFMFLGILVGVGFGLVPGLHPNTIVLLVPLLAQLNLQHLPLIAFIVSVGISNTFLDFIPSMLFGAAEAGNELTVLPSHRMLLEGNGYDAVKLAVIGGIGSIFLVALMLPLIIFGVPSIYEFFRPVTYALLIFIVGTMVFFEKGTRARIISLSCFVLAGAIGIASQRLPIENAFLLFPIFSGMFGVSVLLFGANKKIKIPQRKKDIHVSGRQQRRAVLFGSLGGISSALLPGVGTSEIASLASVDKNEKSFLMTVGAITLSNTLISVMALWLIEKSRSGIAVILEQLVTIGFNEIMFIAGVALVVAGVSALLTLALAKKTIGFMGKINYSAVNRTIIVIIVAMTIIFTGAYGLLLLVTCTALGVFVNLSGIRRSTLMGVLILPTIIFYLPF